MTHAALVLQFQTGSERTAAIGSDPAAVFAAAADRGVIGRETALRLSATAAFWRNLHGSLRIIGGGGFSIESATPKVKSAIAEACGQPDFEALMAVIAATAAGSTADLAGLADKLHRSDAT